MACQDERGSRAASVMRFWRRENFLRLDRWEIRGSNAVKRFDVKSSSERDEGSSTASRSWSWKLVRSRTVGDDDASPLSAVGSEGWPWLEVSGDGSIGESEGRFCNCNEKRESQRKVCVCNVGLSKRR